MNKKTALLTQVVMTFIMAAVMSGLMSLIAVGPSMSWLASWPKQFVVAWPIAFLLTMVAWPLSMRIAGTLVSLGRRPVAAAETP